MKELIKRSILNWGATQLSLWRLHFFMKKLSPESIAIDCGANQGDMSIKLAKKIKKVIAFEPDPIAFNRLQKNTAPYPNIEIHQKAVGTINGVLKLYKHQNQTNHPAFTVSSSLIAEKVNIDTKNYHEVEVIDFLAFINQLQGEIDLVKMDIEGAEVEILENILKNNGHQKIKYMLIETHENKIPSQKERINHIKEKIKEKKIKSIKLNWL